MKFLLIAFLLISFLSNLEASKQDTARSNLLQLLKERKELFQLYSESIDKKSGLFGNKTKNDLRDSQDKLLAVIATDNKIMNSLSRTLDFRNFEKINMSYDVTSFEDRLRNLSVLNDTLNNQYLRSKKENKSLHSTVKKYHLYIAFLVLLVLLMGIGWIRKTFFK